MRWWILMAVVALAAGLTWWLTRGDPVAPAAPAVVEAPAAVEAPASPAVVTGGQISGRVIRRGEGVGGARVVARSDSATNQVSSDASGAFALRGLSSGRYWLSASTETEASPLAGPVLVLGPEPHEGWTLELLAAGTVLGTVYDAVTRGPVPGARVESSGGATVSDRAGRFTLRGLPVGQTWVEANALGYLRRVEWLTLDAARELGGMEIFLRPQGVLRGVVTRMGTPVAGASVWAEPAGVGAAPRSSAPVLSSADGTFQLFVGAGAWRVAAAAAGGARVAGPSVTLAEGESRGGLNVELGEGLEVSGLVRVRGAPAPGVALWLLDGKSQKVAASAQTTAGGRFSVTGLSTGSYLVQAQRGALVAQRGPFELQESGQQWSIDLDDARALTGNVEPAKAGVQVRWRSSDWAGPSAAETFTDTAGAFRFEGVPEGTLFVEAQDEVGGARARATAGTPVVLKLVPAFLKGSVFDEAGHAVTDFTVRLSPVEGGPLRSYPLLSPSGDFQIQVPPGTYDVSAVAAGHGDTADHPKVEVRGGEAYVKLTLQGADRLHGKVLDAKTRQPVSGAEVIVFRSPFGSGRWATVLSGSDGAFEVPVVPKNHITQVSKEGYETQWVGGSDGVEVALNPGPASSLGRPYEGVGAQLDFRAGVHIASVFEGGPAEAAGLLAGDQVLSVDGQSVSGLSGQDVVSRIMGESGTVVRLSIQRADQTFDLFVRRQSIQF